MTEPHVLKRPAASNSWLEYRAAFDLMTMPLWLTGLNFARTEDVGQNRYVCVLPGFGAGDQSMYPLRFYLQKHGFQTFGWGLGVNRAGLDRPHDPAELSGDFEVPSPYNGEAGVLHLCDLMVQRIRDFHAETGEPVALVGWSLGGTIAREVARDLPEVVDRVVTMGSPLLGGPKYTAAAPLLARRGLNLDWIEQQVLKRNEVPLQCKASAIVSATDGVVDESASMIPGDTQTEYKQVNVSHLGMGFNAQTLAHVLDGLR
jgi:pimeloyl-ACP methyl ester carboxylesterase